MSRKRAKEQSQTKQPAMVCTEAETTPDWSGQCEVCGMSPVVPITGMCGPCTFGESETAGGNW